MDSLFQELIAVDSGTALNFFAENLRETVGARRYKEDEMFYVASILAHYAQTSRYDASSMPSLSNLSEVFDTFILQTTTAGDPDMLEIGGSQVLLFAGFFRDQMTRRHNVGWYDQIGQSLYERASQHVDNKAKRQLFEGLSESFPAWTGVCSTMSRTFRENRFLLRWN
jgi:hypothetical protein